MNEIIKKILEPVECTHTNLNTEKNKGITLVALVITIIVDLVFYDKNRKYCNLVGFSL